MWHCPVLYWEISYLKHKCCWMMLFALDDIWLIQPHRRGIKHFLSYCKSKALLDTSGDDSLCNHLPSSKISKVYFIKRPKCFVYFTGKNYCEINFLLQRYKVQVAKIRNCFTWASSLWSYSKQYCLVFQCLLLKK